MSLLTETYEIIDHEVAAEHLKSLMVAGAEITFNEAVVPIRRFMEQCGAPANPSLRVRLSDNHIFVSIRRKAEFGLQFELTTRLSGQKEWSCITFIWTSEIDQKPIISTSWDQVVSINNRRRGEDKWYFTLPQEMFKPLYDTFYEYRRKQSGYL